MEEGARVMDSKKTGAVMARGPVEASRLVWGVEASRLV